MERMNLRFPLLLDCQIQWQAADLAIRRERVGRKAKWNSL